MLLVTIPGRSRHPLRPVLEKLEPKAIVAASSLDEVGAIAAQSTQMQIEDKLVNLAPGMSVTAEIRTGERRIISYLLSPLRKYRQDSFTAFERGDFPAAIEALGPLAGENERIGGSRAQHDLIEFTLLKAYLNAGRVAEARHLLGARRPGASGVPVAGVAALH
jgi:hypothetical protein